MKHNAIFSAALSALMLTLSAGVTAAEADALSVRAGSFTQDMGTERQLSAAPIGSSEKLAFSCGGKVIDTDEKICKRFITVFNNIIESEPLEPISGLPKKMLYNFTAESENVSHSVAKLMGEYGYYLLIDGSYYPANDKMDLIAYGLLPDSSDPADRLLECSCKCPEPITNDDYIKAAQKCVFQWLDTLSDESGAYRVESYYPLERAENKFIAAGIVSGAKEFAVEVRFTVDGVERGSVFKRPADSGYNDFYHYYDGSCAFVRCRWENGVCRVVDYGKAFRASVSDGLYGINTSKSGYATFFDFFNDKKAVESYKEKNITLNYNNMEVVVSHNPFMISDGKIFYADIGLDHRRDLTSNEDKTVSGKFGDVFYAEDGTCAYSSPVKYNQEAYEPYELTFTDGFSLVFDDYNNDGNPDYTIKTSENEQGSYYSVSCISNDGSPRAGGSEVFVAGRFEDSIRLQNTENGYVTWSDRDGKLTPSRTVEDYRMYSQRFYLPTQFRGYTDEDRIICYFWNNTSKKVTAGGEYRIERKENDKWTDTGVKGTVGSRTALPCRETEFSFDISGLSERPTGEYRIAMKCGSDTVYGGFYISSGAAVECEISAETKTLPAGRTSITFNVANTCVNPVRITSAQLMKNGKKAVDIDVSGIAVAEPGKSVELAAFANEGELFGEGKYSLKISCGDYNFSGGTTTLKSFPEERLSYFGGTAEAVVTDAGLNVTLKNNIWSKKSAEIAYVRLCVLRDGEWVPAGYTLEYDDIRGFTRIDFGKTVTLKFNGLPSEYLEDEDAVNTIRGYFEMIKSELDNALRNGEVTKAEYARFKSMSYEDFTKYIFGITEIFAGDQCMLELSGSLSEKIYFTVK